MSYVTLYDMKDWTVKAKIDDLFDSTFKSMCFVYPSTMQIIRALGLGHKESLARKLLKLKAAGLGITLPGARGNRVHRKFTIEDLLVKNPPVRLPTLIEKLRTSNAMYYTCFTCGNLGRWSGASLRLHLYFINGDKADCRKENLRWICPNCLSQLTNSSRK